MKDKKLLTVNREILRHIAGGQALPGPLGPFTATLRTVTVAACPQPTWTKQESGCNCA
jgi:hypothetical protein